MEILYIAIIIVLAIGLPMGYNYLKSKNMISQESIDYTANLFNLSKLVVAELNLPQEKLIDKLTDTVLLSLNYVCDSDDVEGREATSINYCIELCGQMGIEVTDNRLQIIQVLIHAGLTDSKKVVEV